MDDWEPDDRTMSEDGYAYLWIVPADVQGTWVFKQQGGEESFPVTLKQKFQTLEGTVGERNQQLTDAKLSGAQLNLAFEQRNVPVTIVGRVAGDRIEARLTREGKVTNYIATRR
jgi:hypothetical protein